MGHRSDTIVDAIKLYFHNRSFRKTSSQMSIPKSTIHSWVTNLHTKINKNHKRQVRKRSRKRVESYESIIRELTDRPFHTEKYGTSRPGGSVNKQVVILYGDWGRRPNLKTWNIRHLLLELDCEGFFTGSKKISSHWQSERRLHHRLIRTLWDRYQRPGEFMPFYVKTLTTVMRYDIPEESIGVEMF